jgi:hypothetical protein
LCSCIPACAKGYQSLAVESLFAILSSFEQVPILPKVPGFPDFSWYNIPKQGKIHQITRILRYGEKILPNALIYSKWPLNSPTCSTLRPSKLEFWFENIPYGNLVSCSPHFIKLAPEGSFLKEG